MLCFAVIKINIVFIMKLKEALRDDSVKAYAADLEIKVHYDTSIRFSTIQKFDYGELLDEFSLTDEDNPLARKMMQLLGDEADEFRIDPVPDCFRHVPARPWANRDTNGIHRQDSNLPANAERQ